MGDVKISALNSATIPLAGTETLPIVQSGETKKVTVAEMLSKQPVTISSSYVDGTAITGTTTEMSSVSLLVPANTYTTNGALEILVRMSKTGTAGTTIVRIYKNTTNTLTGATLIASIGTAAASNVYLQGLRTGRINSNTLTIMGAASSKQTDIINDNANSSITFTQNVDNYILFTVQLGSAADSANISMARLVKYS